LNLYTIDVATGAQTLVGSLPGAGLANSSIAYDNNTNTLYLEASGNTNIRYTVNTSTGATTEVGANGLTELNIRALADVPLNSTVPEPATTALIATGLAGLALRRRRAARRGFRTSSSFTAASSCESRPA